MNRLCMLCGLLICLMAGAQGQPQKGSLSGFVYDASDGEALIGVNIYIPELALGSSTNTSGYYIIVNIPAGEYTLVCEYIGYKTLSQKIAIAAGEEKKLEMRLVMDVLEGRVVEVVADSIRVSEKLYNKAISNIELSPRQINAVPQVAEADLLRALQTLPGILPVSDFSSALYVRGGTPDQNLYLIDGTDVYNPEHAFGIFSTFNTDAIKYVEMSKGGFGAGYGGRLSSILDVTNLDGNREEFEGRASISLLSAKTTLQMPIGQKGAVSGSFRRTYFDKTIRNAIEDVPDYYFYDGNAKAFYELNAKNKITVSLYGGRDVLNFIFNENASDQTGFKLDWGNRTGSVRWTRVFSPRLFANFWVTGSRFSSNFDFGETVPVFERNFVSDITVKGNLEYQHSQHLQLKFGFEQKNLHVEYRETFPGGEVDVDYRPEHYIGYLQGNWRPTVRWNIEAGLRYNYFHSERDFQNLEPRLSAKYRLSETVNLKAAFGSYHQYLHRIPRTFATDIWSVSNAYQNQSRARHYVLGFQKEIASDYQLEVEGYYKEYKDIYQFNQTFITELTTDQFNERGEPVFTSTKGVFNGGDGNSRGFEILLRKDVGAISGWVGYSFVKTEYAFGRINDGNRFAPRHDRRSTINLVANIDFKNLKRGLRGEAFQEDNRKWIFGVNFVYSSGQPITVPGSAYIAGVSPNAVERYVEFYPSVINGYRLPAYARLDISMMYKMRFRNWAMEPYLQVYNIGNRKNVWFIEYEFENGRSEVKTQNMFPILPTLGVNFNF